MQDTRPVAELDESINLVDFSARVSSQHKHLRPVKSATHNSWLVECFFGALPRIANDNTVRTGYSAIAMTFNTEDSGAVDTANCPDATKVIIGAQTTLHVAADTQEQLTERLSKLLKDFAW